MLEDNGRIAQGSIDYRGQDLTALTSNKEWEKIRGAKIATIFQRPYDKFWTQSIQSVAKSLKLLLNIKGKQLRKPKRWQSTI